MAALRAAAPRLWRTRDRRSGALAQRFGAEGAAPTLTGPRCASVHGFPARQYHVPAHRRDRLERLLRYTARGAVALERLTQDANGDLVYTFTHPWSDGTTGFASRQRNSWRSWPRSCRCRARPPGALLARLARTATCAGRSSRRHANKGWTRSRRRRRRLAGVGHGCCSASLPWIWHAARGVSRGRCGPSPPSRRAR